MMDQQQRTLETERSDRRSKGEPFADEGAKLLTLNRGPNRELRIRWKEFKGHFFLDLREWSLNPHNSQWWPEKGKGISIKARELTEVLEAIGRALTLHRQQPQ